jgi:hypothetical protein
MCGRRGGAQLALDGEIGGGDRRLVRLDRDVEIVAAEPVTRDGFGARVQLEQEIEPGSRRQILLRISETGICV